MKCVVRLPDMPRAALPPWAPRAAFIALLVHSLWRWAEATNVLNSVTSGRASEPLGTPGDSSAQASACSSSFVILATVSLMLGANAIRWPFHGVNARAPAPPCALATPVQLMALACCATELLGPARGALQHLTASTIIFLATATHKASCNVLRSGTSGYTMQLLLLVAAAVFFNNRAPWYAFHVAFLPC